MGVAREMAAEAAILNWHRRRGAGETGRHICGAHIGGWGGWGSASINVSLVTLKEAQMVTLKTFCPVMR